MPCSCVSTRVAKHIFIMQSISPYNPRAREGGRGASISKLWMENWPCQTSWTIVKVTCHVSGVFSKRPRTKHCARSRCLFYTKHADGGRKLLVRTIDASSRQWVIAAATSYDARVCVRVHEMEYKPNEKSQVRSWVDPAESLTIELILILLTSERVKLGLYAPGPRYRTISCLQEIQPWLVRQKSIYSPWLAGGWQARAHDVMHTSDDPYVTCDRLQYKMWFLPHKKKKQKKMGKKSWSSSRCYC